MGSPRRVLFFWHMVGNKFLTLFSNMLTNLNLTDMEVGYKAFKSNVLKNITLRSRRFDFEPEVTARIARSGCRIYEVPISYAGRTYAEGKKINWRDGFHALQAIVRYNIFDVVTRPQLTKITDLQSATIERQQRVSAQDQGSDRLNQAKSPIDQNCATPSSI
jgi:hypothetical protein